MYVWRVCTRAARMENLNTAVLKNYHSHGDWFAYWVKWKRRTCAHILICATWQCRVGKEFTSLWSCSCVILVDVSAHLTSAVFRLSWTSSSIIWRLFTTLQMTHDRNPAKGNLHPKLLRGRISSAPAMVYIYACTSGACSDTTFADICAPWTITAFWSIRSIWKQAAQWNLQVTVSVNNSGCCYLWSSLLGHVPKVSTFFWTFTSHP